MLSKQQVAEFIKKNPKWDKTIVTVFDHSDKPKKKLEFNSKKEANEYLARENTDDFIVVEYGCN